MSDHNEPNHAAGDSACQPDSVRGERRRNVGPICDLEVADISSVMLILANKSAEAPIVGLNGEQAWLVSRLLFIMQEAGNGADANKEFVRLFRDLARGVGYWPPCDKVVGVNSEGVELCASL